MRSDRLLHALRRALLGAALAAPLAASAATVTVINGNAPGVGFNDPTAAAPVGGNTAATVGAQRLAVFTAAAELWGSKLTSDIPVTILATFDPLSCDATSAVLGAAGTQTIWKDFPNAPLANTWYPSALANKLAKADQLPDPQPDGSEADIIAFFNADLGQSDCLAGSGFYLGLDGQSPAELIDLYTTVLHEFGHGLGFQALTSGQTGQRIERTPAIWEFHMYDPLQRKTWAAMSDHERKQSALVPRNLVWNGSKVSAHSSRVLEAGVPEVALSGGINRTVLVGPAQFGPSFEDQPAAGPIGVVADQKDGSGLACTPLDAANAARVNGRIALVDRGACTFTVKVLNAQAAGAIAVLVADNVDGTPPPELGGADATVAIPAGRITKADGADIRKALSSGPADSRNVSASLYFNLLKMAGTDVNGRVFLFTPNPYQPGSSISHWDTLARPNLLMEPYAEPGQAIAVSAPKDLTLELLKDIGW